MFVAVSLWPSQTRRKVAACRKKSTMPGASDRRNRCSAWTFLPTCLSQIVFSLNSASCDFHSAHCDRLWISNIYCIASRVVVTAAPCTCTATVTTGNIFVRYLCSRFVNSHSTRQISARRTIFVRTITTRTNRTPLRAIQHGNTLSFRANYDGYYP